MTRPEATMGSVGALVPALLLGLIGSVALAVALSPLFPGGSPTERKGTLGSRIDSPVVVGGARQPAVRAARGSRRSGVVAGRREPQGPRPGRVTRSRPRLTARLATALPPVPSLGTMFALEADRAGGPSAAWPGSSGAAVLVGGIVGVATVERSRHASSRRADLYGARWDYEVGLEGRDDVDGVLSRWSGSRCDRGRRHGPQLLANGGDLDVRGPNGSGIAGPWRTRRSRAPWGPCSRAVGHQVRRGRRSAGVSGVGSGVTIGDTVIVKGTPGDVSLAVTGWFINPGQDDLDLGILVSDDTLDAARAA